MFLKPLLCETVWLCEISYTFYYPRLCFTFGVRMARVGELAKKPWARLGFPSGVQGAYAAGIALARCSYNRLVRVPVMGNPGRGVHF